MRKLLDPVPRPRRRRGARDRRLGDRRALGRRRAGRDPRLRRRRASRSSRTATLTIGADNPAFPPWFGGAEKTKPWKVSDPYSGKGYESAVAYAVAKELGFTKAQVKWTVVPFANSFRPGKKSFDFYLTQVSYTPERRRAVDFSDVVLLRQPGGRRPQGQADREGEVDRRRSSRTSSAPRSGRRATRTSRGTSGRRSDPLVYDTNDAAVQALKNGQLDGIVVDLPTAFFVTAVQLDDGKIVGKLPTKGTKERFGMVFQKGNTLRRCVDRAHRPAHGRTARSRSCRRRTWRAPARPTSSNWAAAPGSSAVSPPAARASRGRWRSPSPRRSSSSRSSSSSSRARPAGTSSRRTSSTGATTASRSPRSSTRSG